MIKVFTTDVISPERANYIVNNLLQEYQQFEINFDLEDIDKILRVEGVHFEVEDIRSHMKNLGHFCEELKP